MILKKTCQLPERLNYISDDDKKSGAESGIRGRAILSVHCWCAKVKNVFRHNVLVEIKVNAMNIVRLGNVALRRASIPRRNEQQVEFKSSFRSSCTTKSHMVVSQGDISIRFIRGRHVSRVVILFFMTGGAYPCSPPTIFGTVIYSGVKRLILPFTNRTYDSHCTVLFNAILFFFINQNIYHCPILSFQIKIFRIIDFNIHIQRIFHLINLLLSIMQNFTLVLQFLYQAVLTIKMKFCTEMKKIIKIISKYE